MCCRSGCLCLKNLPQTARCTMLRSDGNAVAHSSEFVSNQLLEVASEHLSELVQIYVRRCFGTCIGTLLKSVEYWGYLSALIFPHICCSKICVAGVSRCKKTYLLKLEFCKFRDRRTGLVFKPSQIISCTKHEIHERRRIRKRTKHVGLTL